MSDLTKLGKKAEGKISEWLTRPEEGCCLQRLYDKMSGWKGDNNPCDFLFYRRPFFYYIESKATYENRFDYSMLSDNQHDEMLKASQIDGVKGYVIVLFATYKRAFIFNIQDIDKEMQRGTKSKNITKIDKWEIPFIEIETIPSRKELLDYNPEQIEKIFS